MAHFLGTLASPNREKMRRRILHARYAWIMSGGCSLTGERVLQASVVQLDPKDVLVKRIPNVKNVSQITGVVKDASEKRA